jgi:TonB family protein
VSLASRSTGGTIDTRKLDQSLAGATAGGATGATGTSGGIAAATGGKPGSGANIEWENPTAAKGREYEVAPNVVLPQSALDFVGEVRIYFAVNAEGLVTSAQVKQGSGRTDVDNACLQAMKKATFTSARGAPDIRGIQIFTFAPKR